VGIKFFLDEKKHSEIGQITQLRITKMQKIKTIFTKIFFHELKCDKIRKLGWYESAAV